jgi:hypothetical protein
MPGDRATRREIWVLTARMLEGTVGLIAGSRAIARLHVDLDESDLDDPHLLRLAG